ncbi:MAG: sugar ABC transporter ATP-binding protein [Enterocloster sp.]
MEREIVLSMQNICKSFGPVQVLENVDLQLGKGEVMGLIGENGAGKSTLIKILCGIYHADSGEIILNGKNVSIPTAQAAKDLGISTIYQELSIIPDLNAVQNIFLNRELAPGNSLFSKLKYAEMKEKARKVLEEELKVQMDLDIPLKYVPLAQKQMVEIARTVYANGQIVIMDEPTAALQAEERDKLFSVIRGLKEKGHSIIFISHHLDELMEICDFLTVLRDGRKVDEGPVGEFSIDRIISDMVGKELKNKYPKKDVPIGDVIMKVDGLSDGKAFSDVSFDRIGEKSWELPDWKAVGKMRLYALFLEKTIIVPVPLKSTMKHTQPHPFCYGTGNCVCTCRTESRRIIFKAGYCLEYSMFFETDLQNEYTIQKRGNEADRTLYTTAAYKDEWSKTKCFSLKWRKSAESHVIQMDHDRGRCVSSGRAYPWY